MLTLDLVLIQFSDMGIPEFSCVAQAGLTRFRLLRFLVLFNNVRDIFVECRNSQTICEPDLRRDPW